MNIKVDRLKLIEALKQALQERFDLNIAYDNIQQLNVNVMEAYEKKLLELVYSKKLEVSHVTQRNWGGELVLEVNFKLPRVLVKRPEMISAICVHASEIQELQNAIKLLEMSDAEQVNASSYKSVVGYIK
jgi:hypothetical protein